MQKTEKYIKVKFRLAKIEPKSFFIDEPKILKQKPNHAYVEFHVTFSLEIANELLMLKLLISVFDNKEHKFKYSCLNVNFVFQVNDLGEFPTDKTGIKIPDELIEYIIDSSISMSRGILFEKWSGTYLSDIILPPIDPAKLRPKKQ